MERASNPRFVAFDLETTGVDVFSDRPVSFGFVERGVGAGFLEVGGLVNPGVAIPPGATAIHHISDDMVREAPPLEDAIELITEYIVEVWDSGGAVVGMNVAYDLTMVNSVRLGLGLGALSPVGPVVDVLIADRHFDRWRRGSRQLGDLCALYGVSLEGAHSALDDARASLLVFEEQARRYAALQTLPIETINESFGAWYRAWLTSFSEYLVKKGQAPIGAGRYEWPIHADEARPSPL